MIKNKTNRENDSQSISRKHFVKQGLLFVATGASALSLMPGCKNESEDEGQEVSPPEDLMQEHGLLNRMLLIYDNCKTHLINRESFPREAIANTASIIRKFVEDYHEKQEENYLFPRFKKANKLVDLVNVLLQQHQAGRNITDQIFQLTKLQTAGGSENEKLIGLLDAFNKMYSPHESREDTVLFPAFRKIVSKHEYDSLGEEFENNEHKLFGQDGFETMVNKVAEIEKSLGIYELAQFTPSV